MSYSVLRASAAAFLLNVCPVFAADAEHGRELYVACLGCHTEKPEALGPSLKGIVGRKSASLENFRYSNPMMRAGLTWDDANLREFIVNPQAKVRGNRMPFGGLKNASDADDLLAYLQLLK
jgi:cytochrome c